MRIKENEEKECVGYSLFLQISRSVFPTLTNAHGG